MNVIISYIKGAGVLDKERLVLKVLKDDDIGYYIIFNTDFIEEEVSTNARYTFWFSDKKVHAGDLVVLYTKKGTKKERLNKSGSTTHFFYWGQEKTLWDGKNDAAVLIAVKEWSAKGASLIKK